MHQYGPKPQTPQQHQVLDHQILRFAGCPALSASGLRGLGKIYLKPRKRLGSQPALLRAVRASPPTGAELSKEGGLSSTGEMQRTNLAVSTSLGLGFLSPWEFSHPASRSERRRAHGPYTRTHAHTHTHTLRVSSFMAAPPYLTTTVSPRKRWMLGSASERMRTRSSASIVRFSCSACAQTPHDQRRYTPRWTRWSRRRTARAV